MNRYTARRVYLVFLLVFLAAFVFLAFVFSQREKTRLKWYEPSQIKAVETFNSQSARNEVGGFRVLTPPPNGELTASFKRGDALNDIRGSSYWLSYRIPKGEFATFETNLNNLDISQAKELRFWMRQAAEDEPRLSVVLTDAWGKSKQVKVARYSAAKNESDWQEVRFPKAAFAGVDFGNLKSFKLVIQAEKSEPAQGFFYFDHLIFVGFAEIAFNSLADNLGGFPRKKIFSQAEREAFAGQPQQEMLLELARLTWKYFDNLVNNRTHLIVDNIETGEFKAIGDYTSPTNIGLYLMACVSAYELEFISKQEAVKRIQNTLTALEKLEKWKGFPFNFYNTTNMQVTRRYVSVVDSGWLAAGLIVIAQAFPAEVGKRADDMLNQMNFSLFYTPSLGQLRLGYDDIEKSMTPFHYGLLVTENRVASFIAIAKGDVPEEHWYKLYRTPPAEWDWQNQKPLGSERSVKGNWVFGGLYKYKDAYIVPSWGGSLFEFLMPSIVMKEQRLSQRGLGKNNDIALKINKSYALGEKKYPVWGLSPCSYPGGYGEFGVKAIGVKGYGDFGIVTPHASILGIEYEPEAVVSNIREFIKRYPILGEYGLYDSVKVKDGKVAQKYLALDQGMILISLTNHLKAGAIRRHFHHDPRIRAVEHLLRDEKFF